MKSKETETMRTGMSSMLGLGHAKTETPVFSSEEIRRMQVEEVRSQEAPSVGRRGRPKNGEVSNWNKNNSFTTTLVLNKERYLRVSEIAYEERMSRKDVFDRLLQLGLDAYENNHNIIN